MTLNESAQRAASDPTFGSALQELHRILINRQPPSDDDATNFGDYAAVIGDVRAAYSSNEQSNAVFINTGRTDLVSNSFDHALTTWLVWRPQVAPLAAAFDRLNAAPVPVYDVDGFARCPVHNKRLRKGKNSGYYCSAADDSTESGYCSFKWDGTGYSAPVVMPAVAPAYTNGTNGHTNGTNGHTNGKKGKAKTPAPPDADDTIFSQRIIGALADLGYTFRLNLCNDTIEVNGEPITDIVAARIRTQLRDTGMKKLGAVEDAYLTEAATNAYHPIKDYLNALEWDGRNHIYALSQCLQSDDTPVTYGDGRIVPLHHVYLTRWLLGATAKALDGHQNLMLVLAGAQGLGKSTFAAWLCSQMTAYFIEEPINTSDKDSEVRLMSRFVWEVAELDATTRKADVSALKAFITKRIVTVRKSYGRHDTVKPAIASMLGTVNNGTGFLTDDSGNRRFYITNITRIDRTAYETLDVGQVWAEAVARYRRGDGWRLLPEENRAQVEINKGYEVESLFDGYIPQYFRITNDPDDKMTAAEIVQYLQSKEVRLGSDKATVMEISRVLQRLGVKKCRNAKERWYEGITTK